MKLRNLLLAIALLGFGLAVPMGFTQDQGKDQGKNKSDKNSPAATQSDPGVKPDAKDSDDDSIKDADSKDAANKDVNPAKIITPADPAKVKHDGGKEDVDAVGNRNVGCGRGLGNWYSIERQVAMG